MPVGILADFTSVKCYTKRVWGGIMEEEGSVRTYGHEKKMLIAHKKIVKGKWKYL
jgi:hypothetical protein